MLAIWYKNNYALIHHLLPAIVLEIILLVLFNFHIGNYLHVLAVATGIIVYPFFDFTVFYHNLAYRFFAGLIISIGFGLFITLGGIAAALGIVWVVLSLLLPVITIVILGLLPSRLKMNGLLFALVFSMGVGTPLPIEKTIDVGIGVAIGGCLTAILYAIYYRIFVKIDRVEAEFYFTRNHISKLFTRFNPRRIRFGISLYLTAVAAYLVSVYLSHKIPFLVSPQKVSWAPFFVFGLLQYTTEVKPMYKRAIQRFIGTAAGLLLVFAILHLVHNAWLLSAIFVIATIYFLTVNFRPPSYTHFVGGSCVYVIFLYIVIMHDTPNVMLFRLAETTIAVVIAILSLLTFWPLRRKLMPLGEWENRD